METTTVKVPPKCRSAEGHKKTQIPQETMLQVLFWLDRFDLDGKQITARRLRSLVENNRMPLRNLAVVFYNGDDCRHPEEKNSLFIDVNGPRAQPKVELRIESSFHILHFSDCDFDMGEKDTLSETLSGSTFQHLSLFHSNVPGWQINDNSLESLRLRGCNEIVLNHIGQWDPFDDTKNLHVTEEGILNYCFSLDACLSVPKRRVLQMQRASVTPEFFKKLVDASKHSRPTTFVELHLEHVHLNIADIDVSVTPLRIREYDPVKSVYFRSVLYKFADHGDGARLVIKLTSRDAAEWQVIVLHGPETEVPLPDGMMRHIIDTYFRPGEDEEWESV